MDDRLGPGRPRTGGARVRLDLALAAAAFALAGWSFREMYDPAMGDSPLPLMGVGFATPVGVALLAAAVGLRRGAAWGAFLHQVGLTWAAVVVLVAGLFVAAAYIQ